MSTFCTHCGAQISDYTIRGEHYCDACSARQQASASAIDEMKLGGFAPVPARPAHGRSRGPYGSTCVNCTAPVQWWAFRSGRNAPFEPQPLVGLPAKVRFLVDTNGIARQASSSWGAGSGPTDSYWLCHWEVCPHRVLTRPHSALLARIWDANRSRLQTSRG